MGEIEKREMIVRRGKIEREREGGERVRRRMIDGEDVIKPWIDGEGGEREPRHQTRTGLVGEVSYVNKPAPIREIEKIEKKKKKIK